LIKFYFVCVSPWAYMAMEDLKKISNKYNQEISFKPIDVLQTWKVTQAGKSLADRPKVLQEYRLIELARWSKWRKLEFNFSPKYHPVPYELSSAVVIASESLNCDTFIITRALMRGCWEKEQDISNRESVMSILDSVGVDVETIMRRAESDLTRSVISNNTLEALSDGVWSVPSFVINGELFFGQDRLEMIDWYLSKHNDQ